MHITSGLSPASGELLDSSINFYGDAGECTPYLAIDHTVPESSHTVEIEYVFEPDAYIQTQGDCILKDSVFKATESEETNAQKEVTESFKLQKQQPEIIDDESEDLTNLTWLQNITNIMHVPQFPLPMSPAPPAKPPSKPSTRLDKFNRTIAKCQNDFTENKEEYQTNGDKKPPFSYSTIICMAMRYNDDKMTLSDIYSWIKDNFKYYRKADPTWQVCFFQFLLKSSYPNDDVSNDEFLTEFLGKVTKIATFCLST